MQEVDQISFPPEVLSRIAPDLSLERHLKLGLRPCLRSFSEFKPIAVSLPALEDEPNLVGLSIVSHGQTKVICGISLGAVEAKNQSHTLNQNNETNSQGSEVDGEYDAEPVYPVVDIARGRSGAPTEEEMILSQRLYEWVLQSKIIPTSALLTNPGVAIANQTSSSLESQADMSIIYPEDSDVPDLFLRVKPYKFVLYVHLKVFGRSGPLFDPCHAALIGALKNTRLPRIYVPDSSIYSIKIPIRSRGNFGHRVKETRIFIDENQALSHPLRLNKDNIGGASNYGLYDLLPGSTSMDVDPNVIILADLEGDAEEAECMSKLNLIYNPNKKSINNISYSGGGVVLTKDTLKQCFKLAKKRAENTQ